jgi:mono/diheme cytochrome c family protein
LQCQRLEIESLKLVIAARRRPKLSQSTTNGQTVFADNIMLISFKILMHRRTPASESLRQTFLKKALLTGLLFLSFYLSVAVPARAQKNEAAKPAGNNLVTRGKYLVESVAMCGQCHTPRDTAGNVDPGRGLQGGPLWYQPAHPVSDGPLHVPRIGGSVPGTDAEMITLLTTGVWKDGARLRAPMPQFRLSSEDAAAVVAYLRSLNSSAPTQ